MTDLNWTDPWPRRSLTVPVDEELEHYRLLAWLQHIDARYRECKLYPHIADLRSKLAEMEDLGRRRQAAAGLIPGEVKGFDLRYGGILRAVNADDAPLQVLDAVLSRTVPQLIAALERGSELKDRLTRLIHFEPIGVLPLHRREGYLLMRQGDHARAYAYTLPLPLGVAGRDAHLQLRTRYVADYSYGLGCGFERIKADLVNNLAELPNPAVFAFTTDMTLPSMETFVPLAKELVYDVIFGETAT